MSTGNCEIAILPAVHRNCRSLWLSGLILCGFASATQAANIVADFSTSLNPFGVFSYGWTPTLGGPFSLLDELMTAGNPAAPGWANSRGYLGFPYVFANTAGASFWTRNTVLVAAEWLTLHPADPRYGSANAVVRYTAPSSGVYLIHGAFRGHDCCATTTDVHVLHNSVAVFDAIVSGYLDSHAFSLSLPLEVGDTVDFAVGSNGSYFYDSTGLRGSITAQGDAVPEPNEAAGMVTALAMFVLYTRSRSCEPKLPVRMPV